MKKILLFICLVFVSIGPVFADQILVENIFSDIDADYQYRDELQALYDRGMIIPDESGRFRPNDYLNRDEFVGISMEVICERCIQPHTQSKFIDAYFNEDVYFDISNINPYFYCVAEADAQNYVRGYDIDQSCENGDNQFGERPFCPLNRINLEEAVAVLLRNSGIFTIDDNQQVISDIYAGNITQILGNNVNPIDGEGNPYTFYGYIRKALDYEITEYDSSGNAKTLKLLELDAQGNLDPQASITKGEFLRMSYIALKSNNCSDVSDNGLALSMNILDKTCSAENSVNCPLSDLNDPDDTYDFQPVIDGYCETGIEDPTGYIWRFHNINSGEQYIRYGPYINDYTLESSGEWRIYVRVIDTCGNTSEVYSTIFVGEPPVIDQSIDVDIDVYDDDCTSPGTSCEEIEFEDEEDDVDDIFDFDGDVSTSCNIGSIDYHWTFTHIPSGKIFEYYQEYIDDILLGLNGEWTIFLDVVDGCGQTGSETLTYIVVDERGPDNYIDVDIDVYDDDCSSPGTSCEEIEFEDEEDDGDDTFDFDGDVSTSCTTGSISYNWTFKHQISDTIYEFNSEFVDDFSFLSAGVWNILLDVIDGCGQTGSQGMTYIVYEDGSYTLNVTIIAEPIYGYEDLEVDFNAISYGGVAPFIYKWNFGDSQEGFSKNIEHLYLDDGIYEVLLTVTDVNGVSGSATAVIAVLEKDECLGDSDGDGIVDCDDLCPLVVGDESNDGCPILETSCSETCGCEAGYVCSDSDPLTCGTGICVPSFNPQASCLYKPDIGSIYGSAVCESCPCNSYLDFLADIRKCDLVFPAITSPNGSKIYSQGDIWQVR